MVRMQLASNLELQVHHVPGVNNAQADALSRFQMDKFWKLAPPGGEDDATPGGVVGPGGRALTHLIEHTLAPVTAQRYTKYAVTVQRVMGWGRSGTEGGQQRRRNSTVNGHFSRRRRSPG